MPLKILSTLCILALICCDRRTLPTTSEEPVTQEVLADTSGGIRIVKHYVPMPNDSTPYGYERFFQPDSLYRVISLRGAALKTSPDSAATIIRVIPYGEIVRVIKRMQYDTLQDPVTKHRMYGTWVMVRDGNQRQGYIFSSDVMAKYNMEGGNPDKAGLFLQSSHCRPNYEYNPDFHYYGVFKNDGKYFLREVNVSFYVLHGLPDGIDIWEYYNIQADTAAETVMIIGYPGRLNEKELISYEVRYEGDRSLPVVTPHYTIERRERTPDENSWSTLDLAFIDKDGNVRQAFEGSAVIWCGDLDQDGKPDLMYLDTDEKTGGYVLALSSYAKPGEVVGRVGYFVLGYCC